MKKPIGSRRTIRHQLNEALQLARDAKNELFTKEQEFQRVLGERTRLQVELDRTNDVLRAEIANLRQRIAAAERPYMSDAELVGLSALVLTEKLPSSPNRDLLHEELLRRGVLKTS